jgi:hypothetical protein
MKKRWAHRLRVLEALGWLALAAVALRAAPFHRLTGKGGDGANAATADVRRGFEVAAAVRRAARLSPQRFRCLAQALAARAMLRRRGLSGRLHLSAGRGEGGIEAHAWLSLGDAVVLGRGAPPGQVELARFD